MTPITRWQVLGLVISVVFWLTWFWPDMSGDALDGMLKQLQDQKIAALDKLR